LATVFSKNNYIVAKCNVFLEPMDQFKLEDSEKDLNLGIVGYGELGSVSGQAIEQIENANVMAVADAVETHLENAQHSIDDVNIYDTGSEEELIDDSEYRRMIQENDLDGVVITAPHNMHHPFGMTALEEGAAVAMEKPLTIKPEHGAELIELSEETSLPVAIGYQKQFQHFGDIADAIDYGLIGDVEEVDGYLAQEWINEDHDWRLIPEFSGGGNLMDSGSHLMYGILSSVDGEFTNLEADMTPSHIEGIEKSASLDGEIEIDGRTVDAHIEVHGETEDDSYWNEYLEIKGSDATLVWDNTDNQRLYVSKPEHEFDLNYGGSEYDDATRAKLEDFVDALRDGGEPEVSARDAFKVVAATDAAYESDKFVEPVSVDNNPENYL
jgi:predicted dehydrogenase